MRPVFYSALLGGVLLFTPGVAALAQDDAGAAAAEKDKTVEYSDRVKERLAQQKLRIGEPVDRIPQRLINGWNRVDNQTLILTLGVSKKYLVRLMRDCRGLESSEDVQFTSVGGDVTDQDQIKVRGTLGVDSCHIAEIRKLERVEDAEEIGGGAE